MDELVETIQSANIPLIVSETFSPHRAQELLQVESTLIVKAMDALRSHPR